jgi:prepilin-type processing-associated H-X9-DG protein
MPPPSPTFRSRAFTLLELLATIGVVLVLVALLVPATGKFTRNAQAAKSAANLRQIAVGAELWSAENNGRVVPVYMPSEGAAPSLRNWTGLLAPYLGRNSTADFASASEMPVFIDPMHPRRFGYGYNYAYLSWIQSSKNFERWVTRAGVARPSQTVFLVTNKNVDAPADDFTSWRSYVRPPSITTITDHVVAFDYPGDKAQVLWLDGHVSAETRKTLMEDDTLWDRE